MKMNASMTRYQIPEWKGKTMLPNRSTDADIPQVNL